jgi:hypothetical protein
MTAMLTPDSTLRAEWLIFLESSSGRPVRIWDARSGDDAT